MKKAGILLLLLAATLSSISQIPIVHRAENIQPKESISAYDSTKNYLGKNNVKSYIGQTLIVCDKNKKIRDYGYESFKQIKEPEYSFRGRYGNPAPKNEFNTKYEDLVGKVFIVKDVQPDSRQKVYSDDNPFNNDWWFQLENKNDPADIVWYRYDGDLSFRSFPFITMSHYEYLKANIIGQQFIAPFKSEEENPSIKPDLANFDYYTGEKIQKSITDVWTAIDVAIEDKDFDLVIIVRNQHGATSAFETDNFESEGPIDGKMKIVTLDYYNSLVSTYGEENIEKARKSVIAVGMPEDCVVLSWGKPDKINRNSYGPAQWVYGHQYVYIEDGVVTAWN